MANIFHIFKIFFYLGWISFGGPAAHIGYFRHTFVEKHQWLTEKEYSNLVALSQFLPGPGSSQVGFAIGYQKGGILGACTAFIGFTLPSAMLMTAFALFSFSLAQQPDYLAIMKGLKLFAVVIVADACWSMFQNFCKNKLSITLCMLSIIVTLLSQTLFSQIALLIAAALISSYHHSSNNTANSEAKLVLSLINWPMGILFTALFFGLLVLADLNPIWQLIRDFFYTGSLVFGGGHVVLPLLQNLLSEQVSNDVFLSGYAAAQAIPGPMFTFASYLGAQLLPNTPMIGALFATLAVFLPGFLLLLMVLRHWQQLSAIPSLAHGLIGINAAVVGLLIAALYQPIFVSSVHTSLDMALVIFGLWLLKVFKLPIITLISLFALLGWLGQFIN